MHQAWRGYGLALGWDVAHFGGQFPDRAAAPHVVRGRWAGKRSLEVELIR
jgi:hypothetical protein